ncbi:DDE-type integrase/transposase/recombinase [Kitasatospora aureofaciens]|nr:DDE-type integrase/transposase/recombinase [Kitasatospora aureofaciens]
MSRPVLEVGAVVRHGGREWTVAGLETATACGPRIWLADPQQADALAVFDLTELLGDSSFELPGAGPRLRVPQMGLLSTVSEEQRWRAFSIERHIREVETGCAVPGGDGPVDPRYDPASTTLAERERAKAEELMSQGWKNVSRATVRRWRARYRSGGVWGLVPKRRGSTLLGQADPRVVEAVRALLLHEALRSRSRGWKKRMRTQTQWWLEEHHSAEMVEVPAKSTFNKLLSAVEASLGLQGTVPQRRARACRPQPPFKPTLALRPGELVMLDSTPLDALVMLDDGVAGRLELTAALDVGTRSLWGVLRPAGSKLTDVAVLLAQMMTPAVMRPGWPPCLSMAASVMPHERLVALDERLKDAAARPVIMPETVVVDQGKIFVSPATRAACESLGISLQPVPPANGPAKAPVERQFGSVVSLFCQWLPGHTGSRVGERGSKVEQEPLHTVAEIQALWEEFLVHWHHRPHEGMRHPLMPKKALSPNQMWAALLPVTGYVPVPLTSDDFVELLPVRWQAITDTGIRFDYRTYDSDALNGHRGQDSGVTARGGLWEVHYNPYDPVRIWVRLPEGFREVPWIHATSVSLPFTHHVWEHICKTVAPTASRDEHEAELAQALNDFLKRAAGKNTLSAPERRVVAKSRAAGAVPVPEGALDILGTSPLSFGLAGVFLEPDGEEETVPDQDMDEDDVLLDEEIPPDAHLGSPILNDTTMEQDQWLP